MKTKWIFTILCGLMVISFSGCQKTKDYTYILDEYVPNIIEEDLTLPTEYNGDIKLTWSTSDEEVISKEGIIKQGLIDKVVTIFMTVNKGSFTKTFQKYVTVSRTNDFSYLLEQYVPSSINKSLYLPTSIENVLTLEWLSSNIEVLSNDGLVTPQTSDVELTITLKVYEDNLLGEYNKKVVVKMDDHLVNYSYLLELIPNRVSENIILPTKLDNGFTIKWLSSDETIFSNTGVVKQDRNDVELTVVVEIYDGTLVNTYNKQIVIARDEHLLDYSYILNDIPNRVTEDLKLPTSLNNGYTLKWLSSNEAVLATNGIINRQIDDTEITLTVEVYDGILVNSYNKVIKVIKTPVDYSYIMDEYLPDKTSDDIVLPDRLTEEIMFIWASSDEFTLTKDGKINQGREDITVEMTLYVWDQEVIGTYHKDVIVEKIEFEALREGKTIFGYYSTWFFKGYDNRIVDIDVVNLSFAFVLANFTIDMGSIDNNINRYLSVRKKGVRVVLSIQGYEAGGKNFSNAAASEAGRTKLANSILEVIEKYHFDGVDIDWEYPGFGTGRLESVDRANYTLLMQQIYETVKAANSDYLVTAALPGGAYGYRRYELNKIHNYLDFIHLMTYDLETTSLAVHHSALYSSSNTTTQGSVNDSVDIYHRGGVPYNKLVIGIAFYGKLTQTSSSVNGGIHSQTTSSKYTSITYSNIVSGYLNRLGSDVTYYWDSTSKAPYLFDLSSNVFITYENEDSITEKCRYALNNSLGGVMIWELGEDDSESTLLTAVLAGMKRSSREVKKDINVYYIKKKED